MKKFNSRKSMVFFLVSTGFFSRVIYKLQRHLKAPI